MMKTTTLMFTLAFSSAVLAQTETSPPVDPVAMPRVASSALVGNLTAQEMARLKAYQARMQVNENKGKIKAGKARLQHAPKHKKTKHASKPKKSKPRAATPA